MFLQTVHFVCNEVNFFCKIVAHSFILFQVEQKRDTEKCIDDNGNLSGSKNSDSADSNSTPTDALSDTQEESPNEDDGVPAQIMLPSVSVKPSSKTKLTSGEFL